jgi:uncharacterized membrane protein YraQ (UPF0718 family)
MGIILSLTFAFSVISFFADRKKTFLGVKKGLRMFLGVLPTVLNVLILVSIFLFLVPKETLIKLLGKGSGITGFMIAAVLGSISLIPMFITYPLAAILLKSGVAYSVVAVFITTLMMVGVLTLPIEAKYFGLKVSIMRNTLSFIGALMIGLIIGVLL